MHKFYKVAILLPCYNEALAVKQVVLDFRQALPGALIYVFDNNSTDNTVEIARQAGAIVRHVSLQGKGNVIRRMFADIQADIYVMADGDATYDAASAPAMIDTLIRDHLDMVVGVRHHQHKEAYRPGHTFGNKLLTQCVKKIFGGNFTDMLSGYRVFSRRYVKSFPALARGFETETELTVHALELRMPCGEIQTPYGARLEGSTSKLNTYRDGARILKLILRLYAVERPMLFYFIIAAVLGVTGVVLSLPVIAEFMATGLVRRLPTALLSTGMVLSAFVFMVAGVVLETVTMGRRETKSLSYLSITDSQDDSTPATRDMD